MASQPATPVSSLEVNFTRGQDASKTPDKVPEGGVFAAINTTFKEGALGPRDGLIKHSLTFPLQIISGTNITATSAENIFHKGKFQALVPYLVNNVPYLLVVVSGLIYTINQQTLVAVNLPLFGGDRLNEYSPRVNWSFASKYIVLFDFPSFPVIVDGFSVRRADPAFFEVPISTKGAYNQNRLFIANFGNEFTGGDPTGSLATPNAPITFEEVEQVGSPYFGQIFQLPTNYANSPITAMGFLDLVDTSTGIGPLVVATANQIFAYNTQNPRSTWEQGNFGQAIVSNAGIAGQRAMVNVNSDMFFISSDGQLRSLSVSRDEQRKWSKTPISREVRNWLKYLDPTLTQYAALTYFNNRIFVTANPYRVTVKTLNDSPISDYVFGGMVALELDNVSNLSEESSPVWGGLWTGLRPMDFCVNDNRCFVMSKDDEGINNLWEIDSKATFDKSGDRMRYIRSTVYFRNYDFKDPFTYKEFNNADLPFENLEGDFHVKVSYKSGQSPNFLPWAEFGYPIPWRNCSTHSICNFNPIAPQSMSELRLGAPINKDCNPVTGYLYRQFRKAQVKLEVIAKNWMLNEMKLDATTMPQAVTSPTCEKDFKKEYLCKDCDTDWVIDPFQSCEPEKET